MSHYAFMIKKANWLVPMINLCKNNNSTICAVLPSIPLDVLGNANNCTKSTSNGINGGTRDNSFTKEGSVYVFSLVE